MINWNNQGESMLHEHERDSLASGERESLVVGCGTVWHDGRDVFVRDVDGNDRIIGVLQGVDGDARDSTAMVAKDAILEHRTDDASALIELMREQEAETNAKMASLSAAQDSKIANLESQLAQVIALLQAQAKPAPAPEAKAAPATPEATKPE